MHTSLFSLHIEQSGSGNIHLSREIFGISAHLTANAQSCMEILLKIKQRQNVVFVDGFFFWLQIPMVLSKNISSFITAAMTNTKVPRKSN